MKHTLRALLAIGLLVGFYLLAALVIVSLLAMTRLLFEISPITAAVPAAVALWLAIALGRTSRRSGHGEDDGLPVTPEDEPALWQEIAVLAAAIDTPAPDEVRLVAQVNAGVSEDSRLLGLVRGTRRLYVGVPLLLALSPAELRAVLAHELGHYSGKHTALGPIVYRGKDAIARVVLEIGARTLIGRLLNGYGRLYLLVAHTVNRRQELEADELSARLAGSEASASALGVLTPLDAAWRHFVTGFTTLGRDDRVRPTPLFDGFVEMLADGDVVAELVRATDDLPEERSPYDTHPPTSERIARIEALAVPVPDSGPPSLTPTTASLARLEEALFEGSELAPVSWTEALQVEARRELTNRSLELARLLRLTGNQDPRMADAVMRFSQPWRLGLLDCESVEEERRAVSTLVGDSVALTMIESRTADLNVDWLRRYSLTHGGGPVDPWSAARDAAVNHDAGAMERWAEAHSVDLGVRLEERDRPAEPDRVRAAVVHGFVAPLNSLARWRALMVTGAGMFAVPLERTEAMALGYSNMYFKWGWRSTVAQVLLRLAETHPAELIHDPRTIRVPWRAVESVELRPKPMRRMFGTRLSVTLDDGTRHRFTVYSGAADVGAPWQAMADRLGDRLERVGHAAKAWPSRPAS